LKHKDISLDNSGKRVSIDEVKHQNFTGNKTVTGSLGGQWRWKNRLFLKYWQEKMDANAGRISTRSQVNEWQWGFGKKKRQKSKHSLYEFTNINTSG